VVFFQIPVFVLWKYVDVFVQHINGTFFSILLLVFATVCSQLELYYLSNLITSLSWHAEFLIHTDEIHQHWSIFFKKFGQRLLGYAHL